LFGVSVKSETSGGQHWEVEGHDGIMVTAGVGGGLTGKGADLLIIDDPIKNSEEAQSERIRDAHHDWWKSTARTRLQTGAGVILVMTRWHEDDLAGRLLKDAQAGEGDEWEVLCLEGTAEVEHPLRTTHVGKRGWRPTNLVEDPRVPDPLGREVGEALWPAKFDGESLEGTRRAMGAYWFGAMYQQRPAPAEGMLFKKKNFRYYQKSEAVGEGGSQLVTIFRDSGPEVFDVAYGTKFCTVDVADSEKKSADFTVVSTWVVTVNKDLLLWDRERVQFEGPNLKLLVRRVFFEQRPSVIAIERLGFGTALIRELVREGLPIVKLEPDTDKVTRSLPAVARTEEHRVFFPRGPGWVEEEWEPELLSFPNSKNDDQVDTFSYAALQLPMMGGFLQPGDAAAITPARRSGRTLTGGLMSQHL
jgi:predicted phage terminase large subunit-like protein